MPTRPVKAAKPTPSVDEAMRTEPSTAASVEPVLKAGAASPRLAPRKAPAKVAKAVVAESRAGRVVVKAPTPSPEKSRSETRARAPKRSAAQASTDDGERAAVAAADPGVSAWHARVAELAYFIAMARGFAPGRELDDWLEAEQALQADKPTAAS